MTTLVRSLLLLSYALLWGGLTFYTGFVVRIIHDVVVDPMYGGMITQRVTFVLQTFGCIATVLMLWNAFQIRRACKKYAVALALCAITLGGAVAGLAVVHSHLDAVIDVEAVEIIDRDAFTIGHRRYNQLTTIEWIASLIYLPVTVAAWRKVDRTVGVEVENDL